MRHRRLSIVSRCRMVADALSESLRSSFGAEHVSTFSDVDSALEMAESFRPDTCVVDAAFGDRLALHCTRAMRQLEARTVVIGVDEGPQVVPFVEAGAVAYAERTATLEDLVETIRAVHRGETPCSPLVAALIFARFQELSRAARPAPTPSGLTPREHEILGLVGTGLQNKEIAAELGITLSTVKNHVHSLLTKFDVSRRRDLIAQA